MGRLGAMFGVSPIPDEARTQRRDPLSVPLDSPQGCSGHPVRNGRPAGYEHNPKLQGSKAVRQYRLMMATEVAIAAPWFLMWSAMMSGKWGIVSTEGTSAEAREWAEQAFGVTGETDGRLTTPLSTIVGQALLHVPYGFAVLSDDWYMADGRYWLGGLEHRVPDSIHGWDVDERERLVGVVQRETGLWSWGNGDRSKLRIDANACVYLVNRPEAATDLMGKALLRPVWSLWDDLMEARDNGRKADKRWGAPTPRRRTNYEVAAKHNLHKMTVQSPSAGDAKPAPPKSVLQREQEVIDKQLENYRFERNGYIADSDAVSIDTYPGERYDPSGNLARVRALKRDIAEGFITGFMSLGAEGSGGSYSAGVVQARGFDHAVRLGVTTVERAFNGQARPGAGIMGRGLRYNFGERIKPSEFPQLKCEGLESREFLERLAEVRALIAEGAITPTDQLEDRLLAALDLGSREVERPWQDRVGINPAATISGRQGSRPSQLARRPAGGSDA